MARSALRSPTVSVAARRAGRKALGENAALLTVGAMIGDGALLSIWDRKNTKAAPTTSASISSAARILRERSTKPILEGLVGVGRRLRRLLE